MWIVNLCDRCDECGQEHPTCDVADESKQILCFDCRLSKRRERFENTEEYEGGTS